MGVLTIPVSKVSRKGTPEAASQGRSVHEVALVGGQGREPVPVVAGSVFTEALPHPVV